MTWTKKKKRRNRKKGIGLYSVHPGGKVRCCQCWELVPHATIEIRGDRPVCRQCLDEREERKHSKKYFLPTEQEIAEACERIQASWSEHDMQVRNQLRCTGAVTVQEIARCPKDSAADCRGRIGSGGERDHPITFG